MPNKPVVQLYFAGGLGLIISYPSGVMYTNQAGGYSCMQPQHEGVYVPLVHETINQEQQLYHYFIGPKWNGCCANGIHDDDADAVDAILAANPLTNYIRVDRQRLKESFEAWIYVTLSTPVSEKHDFNSRSESVNQAFGFGDAKGILTWANSD